MLNETLPLKFSESGQRLFKGLVFRSGKSANPEIHNLQRIEAQVAQIVVYGIDNFLARPCVKPGTVGAAATMVPGFTHVPGRRSSTPCTTICATWASIRCRS